jgi:hypothetical protein
MSGAGFTRRVTRDLGSRYLATIPFARDLDAEEQGGVKRTLQAAQFDAGNRYETDPINTVAVDVEADEARVTVGLPYDDDHDVADVLGRLYQIIGEWHSDQAPLAEHVRAGGEQTITSVDAAQLQLDRDIIAADGDHHTALLAYPERPLTDDEVRLLEHATDDAVVTPAAVVAFDCLPMWRSNPVKYALRELRDDLAGYAPDDADIRTRGFYPTREVATLAKADDQAREALRAHGADESPHSTPSDDADTDEVEA